MQCTDVISQLIALFSQDKGNVFSLYHFASVETKYNLNGFDNIMNNAGVLC